MNDVRHGLGLREVYAPVQKSAARKLARLRQPRAAGEHGIQNHFRRQDAAVAGDFNNVLARERARGAHDGGQNFINDFAVANNMAKVDRMRRRGGWLQGTFSNGRETLVRNREGLRDGNADDGQPAFAKWRGNRSDGVVEHWKKLLVEGGRLQ